MNKSRGIPNFSPPLMRRLGPGLTTAVLRRCGGAAPPRRLLSVQQRTGDTVPDVQESLIPHTLAEMASDTGDSEGLKETMAALKKVGQRRLSLEERKKRRRALDAIGVPEFGTFLEQEGVKTAGVELERMATTMLQVCATGTPCAALPHPLPTEDTRLAAEGCACAPPLLAHRHRVRAATTGATSWAGQCRPLL